MKDKRIREYQKKQKEEDADKLVLLKLIKERENESERPDNEGT